MKVQISIDDDLLRRLDGYANKNYMSRSGLVTLACTQFMNTQEAVLAIKDISLAMRKIADSGEIDEESKQQLADFERVAQMFIGG